MAERITERRPHGHWKSNAERQRRRPLLRASIAVAVVAATLAAPASAVETQVGFGVTTPSNDALHLADPAGFGTRTTPGTVAYYLNHEHSDFVYVRVSWCRLERTSGVYSETMFNKVRGWIESARPFGTLIAVDTNTPYFARRPP